MALKFNLIDNVQKSMRDALNISKSKFTLLALLVFSIFPLSFLSKKRTLFVTMGGLSIVIVQIFFLMEEGRPGDRYFHDGFSFRTLVSPPIRSFYLLLLLFFCIKK